MRLQAVPDTSVVVLHSGKLQLEAPKIGRMLQRHGPCSFPRNRVCNEIPRKLQARGLEGLIDSPGLELPMLVSHLVGTGNRTWVL